MLDCYPLCYMDLRLEASPLLIASDASSHTRAAAATKNRSISHKRVAEVRTSEGPLESTAQSEQGNLEEARNVGGR